MTGEANVLGRRPDASVRRYGLDLATRLLHVLATKTGRLAYCGVEPTVVIAPPLVRARQIESRTDPAVRGLSLCPGCRAKMIPRPSGAIWGPPHPPQRRAA